MRGILEVQIRSKDFDLSEMLRKIDLFFANDSISEDDRSYLINLARENADVNTDVMTKLYEIESRLAALEMILSPVNGLTEDSPAEEYQENKWYISGNKVLWKDKTYVCSIPEGRVCTWNPELKPDCWRELNV